MFEGFNFGGTEILGAGTVFFNLIIAFLLSIVISVVYQRTHKGLSYSQSFVMMLIISGVIISAVMMVIGNNVARAFGAFGAFSLIRFRTAIKDTKDMAYIFLVLAVGMAVGTNNYIIAAATTIISLLIILMLYVVNFGSIRKFSYILTFSFDTRVAQENIYKGIFNKYLKFSNVLNVKTIDDGHVLQLTFSIKFIHETEFSDFIAQLEKLNGISQVNLITAKNDVEY
ncbi:DUF4956 domain-containing protein [Candidatus Parcubacteria bacterium]|nr:MAG: DUF4956 domain-containing protein [Candidatus Parcubacteria bacterium]